MHACVSARRVVGGCVRACALHVCVRVCVQSPMCACGYARAGGRDIASERRCVRLLWERERARAEGGGTV